MKQDMVQIRITAPGKHLIAEGYVRQGQVLWVQKSNAEQYINASQIAAPVGAGIGPDETPKAGPKEGKPTGAKGHKSSGAAQDGRSTDSAKSNVGGTVRGSSVSPAARASTHHK